MNTSLDSLYLGNFLVFRVSHQFQKNSGICSEEVKYNEISTLKVGDSINLVLPHVPHSKISQIKLINHNNDSASYAVITETGEKYVFNLINNDEHSPDLLRIWQNPFLQSGLAISRVIN